LKRLARILKYTTSNGLNQGVFSNPGNCKMEEIMKRILVAAAALIILTALNTGTAKAGELLDADRIIAAMEESYGGYAYRNIYKLEGFIAALEESYEGRDTYMNIVDQERFIAALGDSYVPGSVNAGCVKAPSLLGEKRSEEAFTAGYAPRPVIERDLFTGSFLVVN